MIIACVNCVLLSCATIMLRACVIVVCVIGVCDLLYVVIACDHRVCLL